MFSKKKTECRVCGYRFTPERENIYTAEEPRREGGLPSSSGDYAL